MCAVTGGCAWLPGGGACMVVGGMCGCRGACMVARGHVWLLGGMHGCQGVCMVAGRVCVVAGEHVWLPGGMCGCWGCVVGMYVVARGACMGYDEIRSMSGRYTSYWNAFLYRLGTVNLKSFISKVLLRIKWKFELTVHFKHEKLGK